MMDRSFPRVVAIGVLTAMVSGTLLPGWAKAQDVPGIEICTAEKTMERRTSCLQSNINFLQKTVTKLGIDSQRKIDAADRQIEALKGTIAELQKAVAELQASQKKQAVSPKEGKPAPAKDSVKEAN